MCAFLHVGVGHGTHQLLPPFVLSFLPMGLPNVNYVADFSVTQGNFAFFLVTFQLGQRCQSPCSVTGSKDRCTHTVLAGDKRDQLLALHEQFFGATGWSVKAEEESTISKVEAFVYICGVV